MDALFSTASRDPHRDVRGELFSYLEGRDLARLSCASKEAQKAVKAYSSAPRIYHVATTYERCVLPCEGSRIVYERGPQYERSPHYKAWTKIRQPEFHRNLPPAFYRDLSIWGKLSKRYTWEKRFVDYIGRPAELVSTTGTALFSASMLAMMILGLGALLGGLSKDLVTLQPFVATRAALKWADAPFGIDFWRFDLSWRGWIIYGNLSGLVLTSFVLEDYMDRERMPKKPPWDYIDKKINIYPDGRWEYWVSRGLIDQNLYIATLLLKYADGGS